MDLLIGEGLMKPAAEAFYKGVQDGLNALAFNPPSTYKTSYVNGFNLGLRKYFKVFYTRRENARNS